MIRDPTRLKAVKRLASGSPEYLKQIQTVAKRRLADHCNAVAREAAVAHAHKRATQGGGAAEVLSSGSTGLEIGGSAEARV